MTVKPATATRPTNSRPIVARASTAAAAAALLAAPVRLDAERPAAGEAERLEVAAARRRTGRSRVVGRVGLPGGERGRTRRQVPRVLDQPDDPERPSALGPGAADAEVEGGGHAVGDGDLAGGRSGSGRPAAAASAPRPDGAVRVLGPEVDAWPPSRGRRRSGGRTTSTVPKACRMAATSAASCGIGPGQRERRLGRAGSALVASGHPAGGRRHGHGQQRQHAAAAGATPGGTAARPTGRRPGGPVPRRRARPRAPAASTPDGDAHASRPG